MIRLTIFYNLKGLKSLTALRTLSLSWLVVVLLFLVSLKIIKTHKNIRKETLNVSTVMAEFVCRTQFSTSVPLAMVILPSRRIFFNKCIGNWRKMTRDRTCWSFEAPVVRRRMASYGVVRSLRDKSFGHPENHQKIDSQFYSCLTVCLRCSNDFRQILSNFELILGSPGRHFLMFFWVTSFA